MNAGRPVPPVAEAAQCHDEQCHDEQCHDEQCHDEVCITCGDTAVPVRILRLLEDEMAIVDTGSGEEEVSVALVSATAGDTILVHAGEAIAVMPG